MAQIEQRITYLLERLDSTDQRAGGYTGRVEEHLTEILRHLEYQRQALAGIGESTAAPSEQIERGIVDSIRRELIEVRDSQAVSDRRTQDTLEAVHSTLSHVVDRLAMIEGDLRRVPFGSAAARDAAATGGRAISDGDIRSACRRRAGAAHASRVANPVTLPRSPDLAPAMPFDSSGLQAASSLGEGMQPPRPRPAPRAPINSTLPPDYPLEPGARSQAKSTTERLAGSEPTDAAPVSGEGSSKSNFIAAARRAAQAAAAANVEKSGRLSAATDAARSAATKAGSTSAPRDRQATRRSHRAPARCWSGSASY